MAEMREPNKLVVKVDVDVSDALKGLKALRREANKTLKALEKVQEATVTNVTIQDTIDSERFAEIVREEIEKRHKAFMERFRAKGTSV